MQTPLRDGVIRPVLSKPERATFQKVSKIAALLAVMTPVAPELSKAAVDANDALTRMLRLTGEEE